MLADTDIKLIDFGMGNVMSAEECMRSKCGTPIYMAPEMFADMPAYSVRHARQSDPR
jgi:serine/threonine protein kinase|eukprot:COSAG01_NODE_20337_length_958_cov_28.932480_2_plen_57_part_00